MKIKKVAESIIDDLNNLENRSKTVQKIAFSYPEKQVEIVLNHLRQLTTRPRRDDLRIGITGRHGSDAREGNISQDAGRLYFQQRELERERQEIGKKIIPNTHTGRLANQRIQDPELEKLVVLSKGHTAKLAEGED